MLHAVLQVILYGVLAGASPTAFAAAITVMQAGRAKALGFGIGFVAAQLLTCSLFVGIDIAAVGTKQQPHHPLVQFVLEVGVAAALIWLAARVRRRPASEGEAGARRTRKVLARLERLRLLTSVTAGVVFGIGVPKRLVLTLLTASTINTAGVRPSAQALLVVVYVAVATAIVWVPVTLFILFGDRAIAMMRRSQDELIRRQPHVTIHALQFLAAVFALDALGLLLKEIM
jgi:Sap, sulfolipid-1-addressing protein